MNYLLSFQLIFQGLQSHDEISTEAVSIYIYIVIMNLYIYCNNESDYPFGAMFLVT